jgi:hypothetical protein
MVQRKISSRLCSSILVQDRAVCSDLFKDKKVSNELLKPNRNNAGLILQNKAFFLYSSLLKTDIIVNITSRNICGEGREMAIKKEQIVPVEIAQMRLYWKCPNCNKDNE